MTEQIYIKFNFEKKKKKKKNQRKNWMSGCVK